ncbi:MAG: DUF2064 domain-containing protein [Elusimicrobiota bacterium]
MMRENLIIYIVAAPDLSHTFEELKTAFGVERSININRDLYIKTYEKISRIYNAPVIIAYSKTKKYYDLRWLSEAEPGFLDVFDISYHQAFLKTAELAFKTGSKKVLWINHLCPFITQDDINFAVSNITDKNLVIGPAKNGGVYFIGFSRDALKIFENIYPLRESLYEDLLDKIKKNRFSYMDLEERLLIKDNESLKAWIESGDYIADLKKLSAMQETSSDAENKPKKKHKEKDLPTHQTGDNLA